MLPPESSSRDAPDPLTSVAALLTATALACALGLGGVLRYGAHLLTERSLSRLMLGLLGTIALADLFPMLRWAAMLPSLVLGQAATNGFVAQLVPQQGLERRTYSLLSMDSNAGLIRCSNPAVAAELNALQTDQRSSRGGDRCRCCSR